MTERAFVADGAKSLEIVLCGVARRLGFDCDILVHDEINFKIRACAPVGDFGIAAESV